MEILKMRKDLLDDIPVTSLTLVRSGSMNTLMIREPWKNSETYKDPDLETLLAEIYSETDGPITFNCIYILNN